MISHVFGYRKTNLAHIELCYIFVHPLLRRYEGKPILRKRKKPLSIINNTRNNFSISTPDPLIFSFTSQGEKHGGISVIGSKSAMANNDSIRIDADCSQHLYKAVMEM